MKQLQLCLFSVHILIGRFLTYIFFMFSRFVCIPLQKLYFWTKHALLLNDMTYYPLNSFAYICSHLYCLYNWLLHAHLAPTHKSKVWIDLDDWSVLPEKFGTNLKLSWSIGLPNCSLQRTTHKLRNYGFRAQCVNIRVCWLLLHQQVVSTLKDSQLAGAEGGSALWQRLFVACTHPNPYLVGYELV